LPYQDHLPGYQNFSECLFFEADKRSLKKGPVFLRLGAKWCPHCIAFGPTLKELAKEYAGKVTFMSADMDKSPKLAAYLGVSTIPDCSVIVSIQKENTFTCNRMGKPPMLDLRPELPEIVIKVI
jgi:thioredoxin-like negative regulator of GroEL